MGGWLELLLLLMLVGELLLSMLDNSFPVGQQGHDFVQLQGTPLFFSHR